MFSPQFTITNNTTLALTKIERARGFLEAATLSEQWLEDMSTRALLLEAHHTTHIEGTRLTLEQAERLWVGEAVPEADPDDTRELLNYRKAFDLVAAYLNSDAPITETLIRQIHKNLVEGVRGGQAHPGKYRMVQNYVVNSVTGETIYTPPPPQDVPPLMQEFVAWLNTAEGIHPVLASGIAQFHLVHIHPFVDGNGRTARLLSTLQLYRAGYNFKQLFTISEYYDRKRTNYYNAIQSVRENAMDMTQWLEYFVEGLATQMQEVVYRGRQIIRRDVLVHRHELSERQGLAVDHLLRFGRLTIQEYEKLCPNVNRRTLQRDIKVLIEKKILLEKATGPYDPTKRYELIVES